uniref:Probable succinyl-diaminopimelate desuccinylase n=1 Tax=candidate division WOR-3 bacterium TaxID=2052148 RepID=A0A7C4YSV5_UNCW3
MMDILKIAKSYENFTAQNLSDIVKIKSLSGEEKEVIEKIESILKKENFDEVWTDGFGNLIGRIGKGDKIIAVDAHIDVVDTGDLSLWDFEPFSGEIKNGYVYGRGSADQKGGAASMITAGKILKDLGFDEATILFVFSIMEEDCDGLCWNYIIEKDGIKPDLVILTEPTDGKINIGQRGRMEIEIEFKGISAHASAPERGINAVRNASETVLKIDKLNKKLKKNKFLGKGSVAVTEFISSSPSLCAIPDYARIHLDRRLTLGEDKRSVIKELKDIIPKGAKIIILEYNKRSYKGEIFGQEKYFPTWMIDEDSKIVKIAKNTYRSLFKRNPVIGKWTFSTNGVSICGRHKIPAIGFGPGEERFAHSPNEKIPVKELVKASAFIANYILKLKEEL